MKYLKYGAIAALVYVVFLVYLLPASFVISQIKLPAGIKLGFAQGTLWHGTIDSVDYHGVTVNNIEWQLIVSSLLVAKVEIATTIGQRSDAIRGDGMIGYSTDGLAVSDFNLTAPIALLTKLQPLPYGLTASGNAKLTVKQYTQAQPWCLALDATLNLTNANISSGFGGVLVDQAQADLSCNKGNVIAIVKPKTNSLGIDAKAVLTSKRLLSLSGFVKPPADAQRDFVELLKFTGQPDSQGRYRLTFKQTI